MASENHDEGPASASVVLPSLPPTDGRVEVRKSPSAAGVRPWLRIQIIERTALIRFEDAAFFFDEEVIRELGAQLDRLIKEDGHSRLLLNLGGVRYLSSDVLGKLAWLHKQLEPKRARVQVCGLDPLVRDMLRINHLDGVFDVCDDEAEALGLLIR